MKPKAALIKVTKGKDGAFTVGDPLGKQAEGRGAYVCGCADCVALCRKKRGFSRAFKREVPVGVYDKVEELLGGKG